MRIAVYAGTFDPITRGHPSSSAAHGSLTDLSWSSQSSRASRFSLRRREPR